MSVLCEIFGHAKQKSGWYGDGLYGDLVKAGLDGIDRQHFQILFTCPRCKVKYIAARFSTPKGDNNER